MIWEYECVGLELNIYRAIDCIILGALMKSTENTFRNKLGMLAENSKDLMNA